MLSGYLLRDVVNKVNEINFASSDDIHTMAHLYESMLREMRDAAGDSGEFYTPRPVIRFMVQQVDPKLGEIVLDPAVRHRRLPRRGARAHAPAGRERRGPAHARRQPRGIEKKPLPYLLGDDEPRPPRASPAEHHPRQRARRADHADQQGERVDVVLTNPPFGGEEEKSIQANFPADKHHGDGLLFLQLVHASSRTADAAASSCRTACSSATVSVPASKSTCSESATSTPSSGSPTACSSPTRDPVQPAVLREDWPHQGGLVLRAPATRGTKKYIEDQADALRGVRRVPGMVGRARDQGGRVETERPWRVPYLQIERQTGISTAAIPNRTTILSHRPPDELVAGSRSTECEMRRSWRTAR